MPLREAGTEVKHRHLHGREKTNPSQGGQRHTVSGIAASCCGGIDCVVMLSPLKFRPRLGDREAPGVRQWLTSLCPESAGLPESKIADKPEKAFVETPGKS
jgi:hypothetical protein